MNKPNKNTMKTFKDLKFSMHPKGNGLQATMDFNNSYGISVVRFKGSYGYERGLWEVAVLYNGSITYTTDITNNVIGFLTEQNVTDIMKRVQALI